MDSKDNCKRIKALSLVINFKTLIRKQLLTNSDNIQTYHGAYAVICSALTESDFLLMIPTLLSIESKLAMTSSGKVLQCPKVENNIRMYLCDFWMICMIYF